MGIDVSEILTDPELGGRSFVRQRPTTSQTAKSEGESASTYTATTLPGIVQPAATADAQLLPEGVRLSDVQAFFTPGDVSPGNDDDQLPDILQVDSQSYRVLHAQPWGQHGYTKALGQRFVAGTLPATPEDDE